MKIDVSEKHAYEAVADEVLKQSGGAYTDYIIDLWTSNLGRDRVILSPAGNGNDFEFDTDWYEGGEVELIGWSFLDSVTVPEIKDGEGKSVNPYAGLVRKEAVINLIQWGDSVRECIDRIKNLPEFPFWQTGDPPPGEKWYLVKYDEKDVDIDLWAEWLMEDGRKEWQWSTSISGADNVVEWAEIPKG